MTDSTGAVLPGATITVTNLGTNEVRQVRSGAAGEFRIVNLVPANYKIVVEAKSFKRFEEPSVTVEVDNTVRADTQLQLGSASETVEVTTEAPLLQTDSGTVGTEIEGQTVQAMPLNGRNPMNLIALAPGVVPNSGALGSASFNAGNRTQNGSWDSYQIGGGFNNENAEYIDGAPQNMLGGSTVALVLTQDAVQEFKVETASPNAEYGRFGGGVIAMSSKSGSNAFHGTAYEYFRNTHLNANSFFSDYAGLPVSPFHQNQYGAAIGGPIKKNKAFFFFNWESFALREASPDSSNVPTAAMRGQADPLNQGNAIFNKPLTDPGGICKAKSGTGIIAGYDGNPNQYAIPKACFDPTSVVMMGYFPLPNSTANPAYNWVSNPSIGDNTTQYNARVDFNASDKQRIFGRYTQWSLNDIGDNPLLDANGFPTQFAATHNFTKAAVLGDTYALNPSTIADLRLSYTRELFTNPAYGLNKVNMGQFGPAYSALVPQISFTALPDLLLIGGDGIQFLLPMSLVQDYANNTYGIDGSLSKIIGPHSLKFGGEGVLREQSSTGSVNGPAGVSSFFASTTGDEVASFLMGEFNSDSLPTITVTTTFNYAYALYATDTWQVNRNLTFNLGLRWETPGGMEEKKDRTTVMLANVVDPNTGTTPTVALVNSSLYRSRSMEPIRYDLFSPRLSFAQNLGHNLVVRGAYAVSFLPPDLSPGLISAASPSNVATTTSQNFTTSTTPTYFESNPFPSGIKEPAGRSFNSASLLGGIVSEPVPSTNYPYMQQWDLAVAKQWAGDWLTEVDYVGTKGTHLLQNGYAYDNYAYSFWGLDQVPEALVGTGTTVGPLQTMENNLVAGGASASSAQSQTLVYAESQRPYGSRYIDVGDSAHNTGGSSYNGMYLVLQKRFHSGSMINANYTWAKMLTDTDEPSFGNSGTGAGVYPQDFDNPRGEKSLASFNLAKRFVLSYTLSLPFGKGQKYGSGVSGITDKLISGWSANGITQIQSGFPLAFSYSGNELSEQLGSGQVRPNYVAGCNKKGGVPSSTFQRFITNDWFNASCFTAPADFQFGNEPRVDPTLVAPGLTDFDFSLWKTTPIHENLNLQFRAEAFNIFNHPFLGSPATELGNSPYNAINLQTASESPREIQLSLRLNF